VKDKQGTTMFCLILNSHVTNPTQIENFNLTILFWVTKTDVNGSWLEICLWTSV